MNETPLMRMMVILLAFVATVLGMLYGEIWLVGGAVVLLLGVFGSVSSLFERKKDRDAPKEKEPDRPASREDELRQFGIMEIRPKEHPPPEEESEDASPPTAEDPQQSEKQPAEQAKQQDTPAGGRTGSHVAARPKPAPPEDTAKQPSQAHDTAEKAVPAAKATPASSQKEAPADRFTAPAVAQPSSASFEESVLATCLAALQAVLSAHSVCLLKQEELALEYDVVAGVGEHVQQRTFNTHAPLVTANMTRRSVTVQRVGEHALPLESLGYYDDPPDVRQVMLAPVRYVREPVTCFLLADTTRVGGFNGQRPRDLMSQFASLIGGLLEDEANRSGRPDEDARPRQELIREAIDRAQETDTPLALVLIYLNRAEALAGEGEAAIEAAERSLEERLTQDIPQEQVARFGELTYGIFYKGNTMELETWATALQHELASARGRFEGGVSIGMAVLGADNADPEMLRADATRALREAYETGDCVLLD